MSSKFLRVVTGQKDPFSKLKLYYLHSNTFLLAVLPTLISVSRPIPSSDPLGSRRTLSSSCPVLSVMITSVRPFSFFVLAVITLPLLLMVYLRLSFLHSSSTSPKPFSYSFLSAGFRFLNFLSFLSSPLSLSSEKTLSSDRILSSETWLVSSMIVFPTVESKSATPFTLTFYILSIFSIGRKIP